MRLPGSAPRQKRAHYLTTVLVDRSRGRRGGITGSKGYKGMRTGKALLDESSAAAGPWRDALAWAVRAAMTREAGSAHRPGPR